MRVIRVERTRLSRGLRPAAAHDAAQGVFELGGAGRGCWPRQPDQPVQPTLADASGFVGSDYATAPAGSGDASFTWHLTIPSPGTYKTYVKYPSGRRGRDEPFT
ncbi:hypothetical protein Misp02_52060 [Microtetraspora sp. NBRC 16547]|nr:hypothetical protein Misp02_52060 [Microtetraspora sp. NBRC 16547]